MTNNKAIIIMQCFMMLQDGSGSGNGFFFLLFMEVQRCVFVFVFLYFFCSYLSSFFSILLLFLSLLFSLNETGVNAPKAMDSIVQ